MCIDTQQASSLEWTGPLKPWLPNGRSLVKYWEPYAFTDPTFAKYKWEAEDQARKGRDGNGALSTGNVRPTMFFVAASALLTSPHNFLSEVLVSDWFLMQMRSFLCAVFLHYCLERRLF